MSEIQVELDISSWESILICNFLFLFFKEKSDKCMMGREKTNNKENRDRINIFSYFEFWGWKCLSRNLFPKGQRFGSLQGYAVL